MNPIVWGGLASLMRDHGLSAALAVAFVAILVFVLKWVFKMVDKVLISADDQRKAFVVSLEQLVRRTEEHTQRSSANYRSMDEAHKYQREEHIEMLKSLQRISLNCENTCASMKETYSGLKATTDVLKKTTETVEETNKALKETTAAVARINGYKDHR